MGGLAKSGGGHQIIAIYNRINRIFQSKNIRIKNNCRVGEEDCFQELDCDQSDNCIPKRLDLIQQFDKMGAEFIVIPHTMSWPQTALPFDYLGRRIHPMWDNYNFFRVPIGEVYSYHNDRFQLANVNYAFGNEAGNKPWTYQYGWYLGHKIGVIGSTDNHTGTPGLDNFSKYTHQDGGLAVVLASANDRASIWRGLVSRQTYATTGVRTYLDFRADDWPMGSQYRTDKPPRFVIKVAAQTPLLKVELIKLDEFNSLYRHNYTDISGSDGSDSGFDSRDTFNNIEPLDHPKYKVIKEFRQFKADNTILEAEFIDNEFRSDSLYYVRSVQEMNDQVENKSGYEAVWSSPIWIDYSSESGSANYDPYISLEELELPEAWLGANQVMVRDIDGVYNADSGLDSVSLYVGEQPPADDISLDSVVEFKIGHDIHSADYQVSPQNLQADLINRNNQILPVEVYKDGRRLNPDQSDIILYQDQQGRLLFIKRDDLAWYRVDKMPSLGDGFDSLIMTFRAYSPNPDDLGNQKLWVKVKDRYGAEFGWVKKDLIIDIEEQDEGPTPTPTQIPSLPDLGDVNNNGTAFDRGDLICFIIYYLKYPNQPLATASPYDVNQDDKFNRPDILLAMIRYLKNPRIGTTSACLSLELP